MIEKKADSDKGAKISEFRVIKGVYLVAYYCYRVYLPVVSSLLL